VASSNLSIVIEGLAQAVADTVRRLVFQIIAILSGPPSDGGTPVDTGWARANWIPSVGAPAVSPVGSRAAVDGGAAQQAALARLLGYKLEQGPVYATNNVPYIAQLNEGSSRQAPAAFVQRAIVRAAREVAGGQQ